MWAQEEREAIVNLHRNAQRLLRPLRVVNEHVREQTFPDAMIRMRRDHQKFLTLVQAIALLHQHQREIKTSTRKGKTREYIEATLDDVKLALQLVTEVLSPSFDEVQAQTRRLLVLIDKMVTEECARLEIERLDYRFTRATVRQYTRWGDTQLRVHLRRLEELEYLIVRHGGPGQTFVYQVNFEMDVEGRPVLAGLSQFYGYDTNCAGVNDHCAGGARPGSGGVAGGARGEESPATTRGNGNFRRKSRKPQYREPERKSRRRSTHRRETERALCREPRSGERVMARTTAAKKRKAEAAPGTPLAARLTEYVSALKVRDFSEHTIRNRESHIKFFLAWCAERGLTEPTEITRPVLERFQRHMFHYRKRDGEPMSFRSQHVRLVALRCWFRWLTRQNLILHNPASEIELPRLGRRLPKHVLTTSEVEQVLQQPNISDPLGLRDRAILEVLYSCGIRRAEVIHLKFYDLDPERGTLLVRQGKGKKDRFVPIGERAIAWVQKYIREARPQLVTEPDLGTLFLSGAGEEISADHLTLTVGSYVQKASLSKTGACHLFRHTMATVMLEGGADVRFIQQMLGHAELSTTEIYTHVSIRMLKQVHTATHPAAKLDHEHTQPTVETPDQAQEELFAALDAEAEEEHEKPTEQKE